MATIARPLASRRAISPRGLAGRLTVSVAVPGERVELGADEDRRIGPGHRAEFPAEMHPSDGGWTGLLAPCPIASGRVHGVLPPTSQSRNRGEERKASRSG